MPGNEDTDFIKDDSLVEDENTATDNLELEADTDSFNADPPPETTEAPPGPEVQKYLNEKLIENARQLRQQLNLVQERINKIESSKGSIKESVYAKVSADYQSRLDETQAKFLEIKIDVDEELGKLRHEEAEATRRVMEHEDALEEAEFRHELGEFTDAAFKKMSKQQDKELAESRSTQDYLQAAIKLYEDIFVGIELGESPAAAPAPTPPPAAAAPAPEPAATPAPTPPPSTESARAETPPAATEPEPAEEEAPQTAAPPPNVGTAAPRAVDRQGERGPAAGAAPAAVASDSPKAMLLLYENGQAVGQFVINQELTIGRSPNNEVVLKEPRVSRRHAVLRHSGNQFMIIDNNSSNGTYVNGHPITEQILRSGDKLQVGSFELVFTM